MREEKEIIDLLIERENDWIGFPDVEVNRLIAKLTDREIKIMLTISMVKTLEYVLGKDREEMEWEIENR